MERVRTVKVRNVIIGEGIPKICVPIIGKDKDHILAHAFRLQHAPIDLVEWRADFFNEVDSFQAVKQMLKELRDILGDIPLLFTFRTKKEGGEREVSIEDYKTLNIYVAKTGYADLIDVEIFTGDQDVKEIITLAHQNKTYVIGSNHDFQKTPTKKEMIKRLLKMQELDVDIPKIAVMPNNKKDVLNLLEATVEMTENFSDRPIITMSMKDLGAISRVLGSFTGSAVTFAAVEQSSAPGQLNVEEVRVALDILQMKD